MKLGARIKYLRTRQRITLKRLAESTGLTTSFLSQLERDLTSPSVSSLEKIAKALNVKVGYFFEREEGKELIVVKTGMGKKVINKAKKIFCESLVSGFLNINIQPKFFTIGVGAGLSEELIYPHGEKFGMVLKGKVELLCDSKRLILGEGDSIYCAYTKKLQKLTNTGKSEAKFLWIVFTPA